MGCYLKLIPNRGLHKNIPEANLFFVCVEEAKTFAMKLKTSGSTIESRRTYTLYLYSSTKSVLPK